MEESLVEDGHEMEGIDRQKMNMLTANFKKSINN